RPTALRSRDGSQRCRRRLYCRCGMFAERLADFGEQFMPHHLVSDVDGARKSFGIRAAVTLDHDAIETKQYSAVRSARIHLLADGPESRAREEVPQLARKRTAEFHLEELAKLPGSSLCGLQRDIAGEPFGHHHVHCALADIVALNEPEILELRAGVLAQHLPR